MMTKPGKTGLPRLIDATRYSLQGLKATWRYEEAFRLEASLAMVLIPLAFWVGETLTHQLLLIFSCALVLLAELLNSAIEAVVDRISGERHPLSGQAKDIASAAVFLAMMLCLLTWSLSLWQRLAPYFSA